MNTASSSLTSNTLLGRLQRPQTDQEAWREFVQRYGPRLYRWCRDWNLQEADAQDVVQNVLLKLAAKMRTFDYDSSRSFRAWLKTLTQHALSDFLRERQRAERDRDPSQSLSQLASPAARDSLTRQLEEEFDRELLAEAMARVQQRVAPHRWEAFRLTALEGLPGAEAAARLNMPVAVVFTAKSKINKLLQQELRRLEGQADPDET